MGVYFWQWSGSVVFVPRGMSETAVVECPSKVGGQYGMGGQNLLKEHVASTKMLTLPTGSALATKDESRARI